MKTFEEYKTEMNRFVEISKFDEEQAHLCADELLIDILRGVSNGAEITPQEVEILIDLYNDVDKWYA